MFQSKCHCTSADQCLTHKNDNDLIHNANRKRLTFNANRRQIAQADQALNIIAHDILNCNGDITMFFQTFGTHRDPTFAWRERLCAVAHKICNRSEVSCNEARSNTEAIMPAVANPEDKYFEFSCIPHLRVFRRTKFSYLLRR